MLILKAFGLWLLILVCAVANGALREHVLVPAMGSFAAFVASAVLLSLCVLLVTVACVPCFGRLSTRHYLLIGIFWLVLTLLFEFGFGRAIQHKTWPQLFEAYTFRNGNLWPLVLIVTTLAPLLAARLRKRLPQGPR